MVPVPSKSIIPERDLDKMPVLECQHLGIDFGGLTAVEDFNLTIGKTEIAGLIGPNGAGKTTVFNLLTKVYEPTRGSVMINGLDMHGMDTVAASRHGIARTFQNIRLFSNMSVEDNVRIGLHNQIRYGMLAGVCRLPSFWKKEKEQHEKAMELLSIFGMQDMGDVQAGSLPYGAQRRLEIVRALATSPSLLLLDEPAAGMNPHETQELMDNIETCILTLAPSRLFINIGTNDIRSMPEGEDWMTHLSANYRKICEIIRDKLPETKVYMMAYYPVNAAADPENPGLKVRTNENVQKANRMVEGLATEFGFQYIDVNDGLKDEDGNLKREHTQDGIHFDAAAYRTVYERLKKYLTPSF